MNILIACEESQRTCTEFRKLGHNAFSCDILDPSGGHLSWHIKGDVRPVALTGEFTTMDGIRHYCKWDLIIAHPPCTYLTSSGNRWFSIEKYGDKAKERYHLRDEAVEFFMFFTRLDCPHIAIENPIGYMSTYYRKPDQIIQPYMFGDPERKSTCLWLKKLPLLRPTNVVAPEIIVYKNGCGTDSKWHMDTFKLPPAERARVRSLTFPGIAKAFATQWSKYLEESK